MKNCFNAGKVLCSVLVLGCMWLAGCGGEAEEGMAASDAVSGEAKTGGVQEGISENREKIRDLQSSQENIFSYSDGYPVGLQFYQGDVVQFRRLDKTQYTLVDGQIEAESDYAADIYLDRADGSSRNRYGRGYRGGRRDQRSRPWDTAGRCQGKAGPCLCH